MLFLEHVFCSHFLEYCSCGVVRSQITIKVDVRESTTITWTPIFEWYVDRHGSRNEHPKTITCWNEIGLRAQKYANHIRFSGQDEHGNLDDHLTNMRIFILATNSIFRELQKLWGKRRHARFGFFYFSCTNYVFLYPTRSERKKNRMTHVYHKHLLPITKTYCYIFHKYTKQDMTIPHIY